MTRKWSVFIAATAACLLWNAPLWLEPQLISFALDHYGGGAAKATLLASVEAGAIALASILVARLLGRFSSFQFLAAASLLVVCGTVPCLHEMSFTSLLFVRFIAGCGEGIALTVSNALVADFKDPDRAYAEMSIINILVGAALIVSLRWVPPFVQSAPVFVVLCVLGLALSPLVLFAPRQVRRRESNDLRASARDGRRLVPFILLTASLVLWTVATSGMYSLAVELGRPTGLSEDRINTILSGAALFCIIGSGAVAVISIRFGRRLPMMIGLITAAVSCFVLSRAQSPVGYGVSCTVLLISVYYLLPFYLGHSARMDPSGRYPGLLGSAFLIGIAAAPIIAGQIAQYAGFYRLGDINVGLLILSALIFLQVDRVNTSMPVTEST